MERPDVIPYTWQGLIKSLEQYEQYADHLEAALARERESVNELSAFNQELVEQNINLTRRSRFDRARIRILARKCTIHHDEISDEISILNREEEVFAAQRKDGIRELEAKVKELRDLIREAAPLEWVMDFEMEEPEEWEERAE